MKLLRALSVGAATGVVASAESDGSISAVQKVVQMLTDMQAKARQNKKDEQVAFSEFSQWCTDNKATLTNQVQAAEERLGVTTAEIAKLDSDTTALKDELARLQDTIAKNEAEIKTQNAQRDKDNQNFLAEQQDFAESIDALERAIVVLSKQNYDRPALIQLVESQSLPGTAQEMVASFLGMLHDKEGPEEDDGLDYAPPDANAYEFQSSGVVEMLKKLLIEFKEKKAELEKEELNSKHASALIVQDLTSTRDQASDDTASKTALLAEKRQRSALLQKEEAETTKTKTEDEKTLADMKTECEEKRLSYEEKQTLRREELEAMSKAIEILSSEEVMGAAEKHLSFVQRAQKRTMMVQIEGKDSDVVQTVRDFLSTESQRLHSRSLGLLAQKVKADAFGKVKKMIQDLISRLLEEAKSDADHKGWCDRELGQSKVTRDKLTVTIDGLTADVENGKATIATLTQDIARLAQEVSEIDANVKKATEMRNAEKAKNKATLEDATSGSSAVRAAVSVLRDFYAKASKATAFVQTHTAMPTTEWGVSEGVKMGSEQWNALANPNFKGKVDLQHQEGMQTFGKTYKGNQDEAGGVLAMLEVIASDFARLQADTESAEAIADKAYKEFMTDSSRDKAVKTRSQEMLTQDKASTEAKLREDEEDLKFAQEKLVAAEKYFDKLKPTCLDGGMTYEQRKEARAEELQSLKEALRILEGQ